MATPQTHERRATNKTRFAFMASPPPWRRLHRGLQARHTYAIGIPSSNTPPVGPSGGKRTAQRMPAAPCCTERGAFGPPMSVGAYPPRIDRVYENAPRPELLCKQARHRDERGFARAITAGSFLGQALEREMVREGPLRDTCGRVMSRTLEAPKPRS